MHRSIALLILGFLAVAGCGEGKKEMDLTTSPNYHANPDPRSYSEFYQGTPLDPKKSAGHDTAR